MIKDLVQLVLDNTFHAEIPCFWQTKTDDTDQSEYIVYTTNDIDECFAGNEPLIKVANVTVKYFYRNDLIGTYEGRTAIGGNIKKIMRQFKRFNFDCPTGAFDGGDVDGIGFLTSIMEFEYKEIAHEY